MRVYFSLVVPCALSILFHKHLHECVGCAFVRLNTVKLYPYSTVFQAIKRDTSFISKPRRSHADVGFVEKLIVYVVVALVVVVVAYTDGESVCRAPMTALSVRRGFFFLVDSIGQLVQCCIFRKGALRRLWLLDAKHTLNLRRSRVPLTLRPPPPPLKIEEHL